MTAFLLAAIRFYFRALARVAPRAAGRQAYGLFSTSPVAARDPAVVRRGVACLAELSRSSAPA